jgi:lysozyme family protein
MATPSPAGAARRSRARFEEVIERVLRHEDAQFDPCLPTGGGRLVSHPEDPGGWTRLGVTLATLRRHRNDPTLDPSELEKLSLAEIYNIYYLHFWLPVRADELPRGLDYAVFDCAVNSGPRRAAMLLQETLGEAAGKADGVIGPRTIAAVRASETRDLISEFSLRRLAFLARLPNAAAFGRGWRRRVEEVERMALADAEKPSEPLTVAETLQTNTVRAGGTVAAMVAAVMATIEQVRPLISALDGFPVWASATIVAVAAVSVLFFMRRTKVP